MPSYHELIEFAPILIVILMFFWQNNVFVKPEQLERKHREILNEIAQNYVEINAYREFQTHIYSKLNEISDQIDVLLSRPQVRVKYDKT